MLLFLGAPMTGTAALLPIGDKDLLLLAGGVLMLL
jgi:hypothetical protein